MAFKTIGFAFLGLLIAQTAIAKTPHTVDFNRGSNDSLAGRAPSHYCEGANRIDPREHDRTGRTGCGANGIGSVAEPDTDRGGQ